MSLSLLQQTEIADLLTIKIKRKLVEYNPETNYMPFHVRLLGKDRMALFSFIQSINTMLGSSIFEQAAVIIAKPHNKQAVCQYTEFNNTIGKEARSVIQEIMDSLRASRELPDKPKEIQKILSVSQSGELVSIKRPRIDLFLESWEGEEYYIDLKTAKPNVGDFVEYKRILLEWVAIRGAIKPNAVIHTLLAIPYNPYEPKPYQRWTLQGLFDMQHEILIAKEFWDFLGGNGTYEDVLNVFEEVGISLRPEIDHAFLKYRQSEKSVQLISVLFLL